MQNDGLKTIYPLTRGLPKTGQDTSYRSADDGELELGWWLRLLNANNRTRFVEREPVTDEKVILDLATGLMWPYDWEKAGGYNGGVLDWNEAIDYCNSLIFAGYSDWRLPNKNELTSIINHETLNEAIWTVFENVIGGVVYYWSSTTRRQLTTMAWCIEFTQGHFSYAAKINSADRPMVAVRTI